MNIKTNARCLVIHELIHIFAAKTQNSVRKDEKNMFFTTCICDYYFIASC